MPRVPGQHRRTPRRVRPPGKTGDATPSCVDFGEDGELAIYQPSTSRRSLFTYDRVFAPGSSQEQVYVETQPLIRSVLDGYNVCIFAYGQTGSGAPPQRVICAACCSADRTLNQMQTHMLWLRV